METRWGRTSETEKGDRGFVGDGDCKGRNGIVPPSKSNILLSLPGGRVVGKEVSKSLAK